MVFQIHQSTLYLKVVEEDTSQDKLRLMPSHFSSRSFILPTRDWHSYGHRPSSLQGKALSIFFESKYVQQLHIDSHSAYNL